MEWIIPAAKQKAFFVRYVLQRMVFDDAPIYNDRTHVPWHKRVETGLEKP